MSGRRSDAWFCSDACRKRAWRRRQARVAEHAYADGGQRGRVPLGEPTRRERRERIADLMSRRAA